MTRITKNVQMYKGTNGHKFHFAEFIPYSSIFQPGRRGTQRGYANFLLGSMEKL